MNKKQIREKKWRTENKERFLSVKRVWNKKNKEKVKSYHEKYRNKRRKEIKKSFDKYRKNNPLKIKARAIIQRSVRIGLILPASKLKCSKCSNRASEYHHPDYSKPLKVIPLCKKHHEKEHEVNAE